MAVYACTDLHGRKDLFFKIKELLNPDDIVYFLGDANDRGLYGWELIKLIYNDPQFIYIKGNHEDMLVDAARDVLKYDGEPTRNINLLDRNGGMITLNDWCKDGRPEDWLEKLSKLPEHKIYKNANGKTVVLSHAGCTPWYDEDNGEDGYKFSVWDNLLWNRDHFLDDWDEEHFKDWVIVHGHTPILHLIDYMGGPIPEEIPVGPYWYCYNHKVCLDHLSVFTDIACIMDLDTFEFKIIEGGVKK